MEERDEPSGHCAARRPHPVLAASGERSDRGHASSAPDRIYRDQSWEEIQEQLDEAERRALEAEERAREQMRACGGMLTMILKTDLEGTRRFLDNTCLFSLAESLGGVESLINHPAIMTHGSIPKKQRDELGITDSLVRLSVGVEDVRDLIDDLQFAFAAI